MSLYVEKLRLPARLSQPNLTPRDGCFLLSPNQGSDARPESLIELLNSSRMVIPFMLEADSGVLLLVRLNIDWVALARAVDHRLVFPPDHEDTRQQEVELRFVDESRVDAAITWRQRTGAERLSDLLNRPEPFVAARASFGTLIVNKHRIREMSVRNPAQMAGIEGMRRTG